MNKDLISVCIPHMPYSDEINILLLEALECYKANTTHAYEICLVINGDPCYKAPEGDNIKIKRFDVPIGNPSGWNEGLKMAEGKYIAFMDNDVLVQKDWDSPLLTLLQNRQIGIALPAILRKERDNSYTHVADNCQGCATVMRRETLDMLETNPISSDVPKCFGYDDRFNPAYCEDTDLYLRTKLCGLERRTALDSQAKHMNGATTQVVFKDENYKNKDGFEAMALRSREKFERKWEHLGKDGDKFKCWRMWA